MDCIINGLMAEAHTACAVVADLGAASGMAEEINKLNPSEQDPLAAALELMWQPE